jgi:hypothetical protein
MTIHNQLETGLKANFGHLHSLAYHLVLPPAAPQAMMLSIFFFGTLFLLLLHSASAGNVPIIETSIEGDFDLEASLRGGMNDAMGMGGMKGMSMKGGMSMSTMMSGMGMSSMGGEVGICGSADPTCVCRLATGICFLPDSDSCSYYLPSVTGGAEFCYDDVNGALCSGPINFIQCPQGCALSTNLDRQPCACSCSTADFESGNCIIDEYGRGSNTLSPSDPETSLCCANESCSASSYLPECCDFPTPSSTTPAPTPLATS